MAAGVVEIQPVVASCWWVWKLFLRLILMHELSIALKIVEIASEQAEDQGNARVVAVHLRLGPLSGVMSESLLSAWGLACDGTQLQDARLEIEPMPIRGMCRQCEVETEVDSIQRIACAMCGSPVREVTSGCELEVTAVEIEA